MAGSGSAITYGELDRVSNQGAQQLRALGLKPQDHIALLAENARFVTPPDFGAAERLALWRLI
jgi:acyl-CoA synthetase (AMP-forming)/AMP-acid ligase II